jgi:hypothetical protein
MVVRDTWDNNTYYSMLHVMDLAPSKDYEIDSTDGSPAKKKRATASTKISKTKSRRKTKPSSAPALLDAKASAVRARIVGL